MIDSQIDGRRVSSNRIGGRLERELRRQVDLAADQAARELVRELQRTRSGRTARLVRRAGKLHIEI
jgi:hypothetical protein